MHLALASTAALFLGTLLMAADLKITKEYRDSSGIRSAPNTVWYSGSRMRMEWQNGQSWSSKAKDPSMWTYGPHMAAIYQCDQHRAVEMNLDDREYTSHELGENGVPLGYEPKIAAPRLSGATVTITVETSDTGERKEMFGRLASHIITNRKQVAGPGACLSSGETVSDGWYIDLEIPSWGCMRVPKMGNGQAVSVLTLGNCRDKFVVHHTGPIENGFPLKVTTTSKNRSVGGPTEEEFTETSVTEVTELSESPLDPALFDVPPGFKKVSHLSNQPAMTLRIRALVAWQEFERAVISLFK